MHHARDEKSAQLVRVLHSHAGADADCSAVISFFSRRLREVEEEPLQSDVTLLVYSFLGPNSLDHKRTAPY